MDDAKFTAKGKKVQKKIETVTRSTHKEYKEAVKLKNKIYQSEIPLEESPLDETDESQQHKKNVALANILTLLSTAAASHLSNQERLKIKSIVEMVLSKKYLTNEVEDDRSDRSHSSEPMDEEE